MKKENRAFTLVELIVVITILTILTTIGFVSFSGYLAGTRDTNRIAQLKSMSDALELYRTKKDLPIPDDKVDVKSNGSVIAYQGYIGKNVLETIEYTESGLDPKDKTYFSYYLTKDKKYFQLMAFLEEENKDVVALNNFNKLNATDYSDRYPKTTGKKLGILTDLNNTPIQEVSAVTNSGYLDIVLTEQEYKANFDDHSFLSGTGGYIGGFLSLISKKNDVIKNDANGIVFLNFNNGIKDLFQNYSIENDGNLKTINTDLGKGIKCDGKGKLVIGSGSSLLGGRDEFSVYISYKVKKGDNTSYNISFASWGTTGGYNIKLQHNFTDINNPTFSVSTQYLDDGSTIGDGGKIEYGLYNNVLFTAKDGKWLIIRNRKIIAEGNITGKIREDRLDGLALCSRPGGGYNIKGTIDKFYISKKGIDKNGIDAFFALMRIND